jgi:AraC-like DNA-binding protein
MLHSDASAYASRFAQRFGASGVRAGECTSCEQEASFDRGSPQRDDDTQRATATVTERRILRGTLQARYAARVREFLVERAPARVNMSAVAHSLGLSVRTLRRRLAAEGKSYLEIEHDALALAARRLLGDERYTIQEAAQAMGFSDATTFHRAFKRWTGMTPSSARSRASDERTRA